MTPVAPTVSALVVSWNNRDFIARTLESLPPGTEVIVVDNGSTDGSAEEAARRCPAARVERLASRVGFAAATNHGTSLASGDYLLLLDADAEATPRAVERLVEHLETHPEAGAATGRLLSMTEEPQPGGIGRLPTLGSIAADLLLLRRVWPGNPITRRADAADLDRSAPGTVEQASASCLLVRRTVFERLGGFDDQFSPAWFEDVDFCHRLHDAGFALAYVPSAAFRHVGGTSFRALGPAEARRTYFRNLERYVRKHHGWVGLAGLKGLLVLGLILRVIGSALRADRQGIQSWAGVLSGTLRGWKHA